MELTATQYLKYDHVIQFMLCEDPNGFWATVDIIEAGYVLMTIEEWLEDGLELTPQIKRYMQDLEEIIVILQSED